MNGRWGSIAAPFLLPIDRNIDVVLVQHNATVTERELSVTMGAIPRSHSVEL